jgi:hypothetical protein
MRWFQFDLRLLFVIITAVGVILALEMARRSDAEKAKGLTSTIRAGEQVVLSEYPQGFEIKRQRGVHSHTVTEVGKDYIRLRSLDGPESVIPLEKIYRIVDDPRPYGATSGPGAGMGGMPGGGMGGMPGGMAAPGGGGGGAAGGVGSASGSMGPTSPAGNGAVPLEEVIRDVVPAWIETVDETVDVLPPKAPPTSRGRCKP